MSFLLKNVRIIYNTILYYSKQLIRENLFGDYGYIICKENDINECDNCGSVTRYTTGLSLKHDLKCNKLKIRFICEMPCFKPFEI